MARSLDATVAVRPASGLEPIALLTNSPSLIAVSPFVQVRSIKELIALAGSKPGVLNYGSGNVGSASHLATELFKSMAQINVVRIPFKGVGPAVNALVAGEVQMMVATAAAMLPFAKTGRVTPLAVTTAQRTAIAPELPTIAESGLPGYEFTSGSGMLAPARTPAAIISRLNREVVAALKEPEVKQRLFNSGADAVGNSPSEFRDAMRAEIRRLDKVIREAGIRAE